MKISSSLSIIAILALSYFFINHLSEATDLEKVDKEMSTEFQSWKRQFNKNYDTQTEEIYRLSIFSQNFQIIEAHNLQKDKSYEVGINQFSDLTESEFKAKYLTLIPQIQSLKVEANIEVDTSITADTDINWVEKGYVTSVKDEGQCGACWAFAAIGSLQALIKLQGKPLVSLSAQQLMDCSGSYGNYGCSGGLMENAFSYIKDKGITTEEKYPYKGAYQKCIVDGGEYFVKGFVDIKDCKTLASSLLKIPVAVAVDASKFYNYKNGVFTGCIDKPMINHAITLVGMTDEYWLGKEQWGVKWGDNGYIKISKTGSACGACQIASYPV